jgi:hypothetical protein
VDVIQAERPVLKIERQLGGIFAAVRRPSILKTGGNVMGK